MSPRRHRTVGFVQPHGRLTDSQSVTLQPFKRCTSSSSDGVGDLRLATSRRAFNEKWLLHPRG